MKKKRLKCTHTNVKDSKKTSYESGNYQGWNTECLDCGMTKNHFKTPTYKSESSWHKREK